MSIAYLSLGTNIGDREDNLIKAIEELKASSRIEVTKVSDLYETEPVGYDDQDPFYNICIMIETSYSPFELLDYCQAIENKMGRVRLIKNGPRIIDIDILSFDDLVINDERLILPHPRMNERAFVLIPLMDIMDKSFNISDSKWVSHVGKFEL